MCETSLSVWFVCRLCRGSFGQVDAFIEHKKQKHFTQFQNTTSIVFEEREYRLENLLLTNGENELAHESNDTEPSIKIEVNDEDPIIPFSPEIGITDEPNLDLVEPKSELINFESKIVQDSKNNFVGLLKPEQNPDVLLKRLTSDKIQSDCVHQHHSPLLPCEQKIFTNSFEPSNCSNSSNAGSISCDHNEVQKSAETPPTAPVIHFSKEPDQPFECKLCSKQLESDAKLRIHVGICALYHEDQSRFCVKCNRKFCHNYSLKYHRLRFHGTEEEKSSLYKFKCHVCPKQYRDASELRFHLESHKKKKIKKVETSTSKPFKCSYPNCGKEFCVKSKLMTHINAVHLNVRPFSCSVPNCNKTFAQRYTLNTHSLIHTGERPFKCDVDNCGKAFTSSHNRSRHHQSVHCNL